MRMAVADPVSASSLRKRANWSTTKLPPKVISVPCGSQTTTAPATTSSKIESQLATRAESSPLKAPNISSAMAPSASTISGNTGSKSPNTKVSVIGSPHEHGGALGRADGMVVIVDERSDRGRRHVEHWLREESECDGEGRERAEGDDLAVVEILHHRKARLVERAEDNLAVEPERIRGRQDGADGRERRDPDVDLEGADQAEKLADKTGRTRQPDIGERENHKRCRIERHAIDQPAIGRDLARVQAIVDHADA